MADISWLSSQAKNIHDVFNSLFYGLVFLFLLLGILVEYFKWPLGQMPSFSQLVGRVLIAALLLHTYPEVSNTIGDLADSLSKEIGDFNQVKLVLAKMGDKIKELTWSWVSVKDSVILIMSFVTFFLLYLSVFVAESIILFTWTILYVFSPLLIALFVLPTTAKATSALYRSLIEVSLWKVVWSVLAALLWSAALSDINKPSHDINFISAICLNLVLAGSLLITPMVVHALAGGGIANLAKSIGSIAVGATAFGPARIAKLGSEAGKKTFNSAHTIANKVTKPFAPKANAAIQKIPRFRVAKKPPIFIKPSKESK